MKAIILAAGYATRLYPLTKDKPKALLPVKGKPMIDYIMDRIYTIPTVDGIYVVSNHKFADHFYKWESGRNDRIPLKVLDDGTMEEGRRIGAIGDILFAIEQEKIDEDVVVICGDNLFTFSLYNYFRFFCERQRDCVCVKELNDVELLRQFAVAIMAEDGRILDLEEKPKEPKSNIAVYATYFYKRETLPLFKRYLAEGNNPDTPGSFPQWLYKRQEVYGYVMDGECYDVGTRAMYDEVQRDDFVF